MLLSMNEQPIGNAPKTDDFQMTAIEQFFEAQKRRDELRESAIKQLLQERDRLESGIEQIDQRLAQAGYQPVPVRVNGALNGTKTVKAAVTQSAAPVPTPKKRVFSAETRAKMAKAQRARWKNKKKGE